MTEHVSEYGQYWLAPRRSRHAPFGPLEPLGLSGNLALAPRPDGSVVAAWDDTVLYESDGYYLSTATRSATGKWTCLDVPDRGYEDWKPRLDAARDGTATMLWKGDEGATVGVLPQGHGWTPRKVLARTGSSEPVALDVAPDGFTAVLIDTAAGLQLWSRRPDSARWVGPQVIAPPSGASAGRTLMAVGNRGRVVLVQSSSQGTYARTRQRTGRPLTRWRRIGVGATFVDLTIGDDMVATLGYGRPTTGLITKTLSAHGRTWRQRRVLAGADDHVTGLDLSTGGAGRAVIGWRQALTTQVESVHVRTKANGLRQWTQERVLGRASRTDHCGVGGRFVDAGQGWVHRGTGRSAAVSWIDPEGNVKVSSLN
jgi:hypothetical protein